MNAIFLKILNMSITASWLMIAVIILRFALKKAPKWISCMLWALVAVRLICPFTIESALSLIPSREPLPERILSGPAFQGNTGMQIPNAPIEGQTEVSALENTPVPAENGYSFITILGIVWICGIALLFIYSFVSYYKIYRQTGASVKVCGNIYKCDDIDTPFILGIVRPHIYLPSNLEEVRMKYVVAHEQAHIRRHDHWWKPIGFLILSVYWFNPLCWLSYILLSKDIELACDENVVRAMDLNDKKSYANALLAYSIKPKMITACPLAFGEIAVKTRIKSILYYKKPAFWIILASAAACLIVAVCFFTSPAGEVHAEIGSVTPGIDVPEDALTAEQEQQLKETLTNWAKAFAGRDGKTIAAMASPELVEDLLLQDLLMGSEGNYSFGYSSPWPWDDNSDYSIYRYDNFTAEIYYYAHTSDPHITYWKENLNYEWDGGKYVITKDTLTYYDCISTGTDFEEAYHGLIDGHMIDYTQNGLGEVLNNNACRNISDQNSAYKDLFSPESAAVFLLNLSADPKDVQISRHEEASKFVSGEPVGLDITFLQDQTTVTVSMIQPYGENGIWVPVNYREGITVR